MITADFILENKDKWEEYKEEINELDKDILRELIVEDPDIIDFIDLDKLGGKDISWILINHPKLIKYLKLYLDKLDGHGIHWILKYHSGLIKDLEPYLNKLAGHDIYWFLRYQPELIKYIKPFLHRVGGYDLSWVLVYQPKLFPYVKPYLYKLDGQQRSNVLRNRPELSLFFKYVDTEYEDAAYYCTYPSEISKLDEEEKQELSKKMVELIKEEKK